MPTCTTCDGRRRIPGGHGDYDDCPDCRPNCYFCQDTGTFPDPLSGGEGECDCKFRTQQAILGVLNSQTDPVEARQLAFLAMLPMGTTRKIVDAMIAEGRARYDALTGLVYGPRHLARDEAHAAHEAEREAAERTVFDDVFESV